MNRTMWVPNGFRSRSVIDTHTGRTLGGVADTKAGRVIAAAHGAVLGTYDLQAQAVAAVNDAVHAEPRKAVTDAT